MTNRHSMVQDHPQWEEMTYIASGITTYLHITFALPNQRMDGQLLIRRNREKCRMSKIMGYCCAPISISPPKSR